MSARPPAYAPHAALTEPARTRPELWRLGAGILLSVVVVISLGRLLLGLVLAALPGLSVADLARGDTPLTAIVLLFSMGCLGLGAVLAARLVHRRSARSLFGRAPWRLGLRTAGAMLLLNLAVLLLPPWGIYDGVTPALAPGTWLVLLPLSLAALLVQTGAEELFFRGYLQSQLAARLPWPPVWIVLPAALFAVGHYAPGMYGPNALAVAAWAFAFGLAMADLTARTGSLGPAIAVHMVNNASAILLVSLQGEMSGLALYHLPFAAGDDASLRAVLPVDLALVGLSWLAARLALRV